MRKTSFLLFLIWGSLAMLTAQNLNSLYFMNEWSSRHRQNASFAPEYGYFSFPFMGNSQFGISSNTGLLNNYIFPYQSEFVTFMHPSVDATQFLSKLKSKNIFTQESNNNFISFGFFGKNTDFWSFELSLREQMVLNIPIDFFRLAKLGMTGSTDHYDLKNLNIQNSFIGEMALGYSKDINEKIRVGGKVKMLAGFASAKINYSKFDVDLSNQSWQVDAKGEMLLNSKFAKFNTDSEGYLNFSDYKTDFSKFRPSGYGIALDLGVTYKPIDGLNLAASFNDLGYMTWRRVSWQRGVAEGVFAFNGFSNVDLNNANVDNQLEQLKKDAEQLIKFKEDLGTNEYELQSLPVSWSASAEYSIFKNPKNDILIGLLWNNRYIENYNFSDFMGAISLRPTSWMMASVTYSLLGNNPGNLGCAINISPKWINIFIAVDGINTKINRQYLPIYPFRTSFQAGITFPLSKNKKDKDEKRLLSLYP